MQKEEYLIKNACYSVTKYYLCKQNNKRSLLGRKQRNQVTRSFLNRYQFSSTNKVTSLFSTSCILRIILHPNQALLGAQLSTFSYERYKLLKYSLLQVRQDSILSVPMTVSPDFLEYEFSGQKIQNGILPAKSSPPCLIRQKTLLSCFSCSQMKRSECRSSSGTPLHQPFSLFEYLGMVEGKAREI